MFGVNDFLSPAAVVGFVLFNFRLFIRICLYRCFSRVSEYQGVPAERAISLMKSNKVSGSKIA